MEGSNSISDRYAALDRPYMRDYGISPSFTNQFIMSPLMTKLLSEAEFLEADTMYNENCDLIYLFNATVFDYTTMKWAVVWKPTSALFWVSDSIGLQPPTASDFNLRQRRTSTSDGIGPQPPTASGLRQRRTSSPTASDFYLRQRRTGLQSPTASDFNLQQLAS